MSTEVATCPKAIAKKYITQVEALEQGLAAEIRDLRYLWTDGERRGVTIEQYDNAGRLEQALDSLRVVRRMLCRI